MILLKLALLLGSLFYFIAALFIWFGLRRINSGPASDKQPSVTIIVPARNEEENITACLQSIFQQDYQNFDVILINDNSEDNTLLLAQEFTKNHANFRILNLSDTPSSMAPKKAAISVGVKHSTSEIIVTTDADCIVKPTWTSSLIKQFDNETGAVVSWLLVKKRGSLLNKVEFLDSIFYSLVGAALVGLGRPILANGANFSYRRDLFEQVGGFKGQEHYASGDDDLLLQKLAKHKEWTIKFDSSRDAIVQTNPAFSIAGLFSQRLRWASKGPIYPSPILLLQAGIYIYFLAILTSCLFAQVNVLPFLFAALFTKFVSDYVILFTGKQKLKFNMKSGPFILFEAFQIIYIVFVGIGGMWGHFTWKGRKFVRGQVIKE